MQKKLSLSTQKNVPVGIGKIQTKEHMLLQAAWYLKIAGCQYCHH